MGKAQDVKERTQYAAQFAKERMDLLINKAFNTGAFDMDYAFKNGMAIPHAIVSAVLRTVMDEINSDCTVKNEAYNIYQFL